MAAFIKSKNNLSIYRILLSLIVVEIAVFFLTQTYPRFGIVERMQLSTSPSFNILNLISYMFVHNNPVHLFSNITMLLAGFFLFQRSRTALFIPLFLLGGIAGGMGFAMSDIQNISLIGASNGVCAILAAATVFPGGRYSKRVIFRIIAGALFLFALLGNDKETPVLAGHLCGAASGLIASFAFYLSHKKALCIKHRQDEQKRKVLQKLRNSGFASLDEEEKAML